MATPTPQATNARSDPFTVGNFRVEIQGFTATGFSEVRGLETSIEIVDYRPGDSALNSVQKLPGLHNVANVTLKRGLTGDLSLWNWIRSALNGELNRTAIAITLLDPADNPVLTWTLRNAWPCRWTGPVLNGGCSEVAMEELEICHEGLDLAGA